MKICLTFTILHIVNTVNGIKYRLWDLKKANFASLNKGVRLLHRQQNCQNIKSKY